MIESSSWGKDERLSEDVEVLDSQAEEEVLDEEEEAVLVRFRVLLNKYDEYVDRSLYSEVVCFLGSAWDSVCFCEFKKWSEDELSRSFGFSVILLVKSHGVLIGSSI